MAFGLSFLTRHSNGDLGLAAYHPRKSGTWIWSVSLTRKQPYFPGVISRLPTEYRRNQWHTYVRLPFRYALCISRQDYHRKAGQ